MRLCRQGKGPIASFSTMESAKNRCTCMLATVQVRTRTHSWCGTWHGESSLACTQPSARTSFWLATPSLRRTGVLASSRGNFAEPECRPWQTLLALWRHRPQPTTSSVSAMRQEMCSSLPRLEHFPIACLQEDQGHQGLQHFTFSADRPGVALMRPSGTDPPLRWFCCGVSCHRGCHRPRRLLV